MSESIDLGSRYLVATKADHILTVRLNRPEKRNAATQDMYRGIKRAAILADGDPEVDVLCLTGTDRWFGAGGDMSGEAEDPDGLSSELDPTDHFPFRHLERCQKAVFSAVNGVCHAGGLDFVLYSDVAIASDRARFRAPELLRGAPDPYIAARLASYVGVGVAKYLLFTGVEFDAHEALRMGLLGKVVPHDEFEAEVANTCALLRGAGPKSRAMVKDDMNAHLPAPNVNMFKRSILSPEMIEGMRAFLEKRPPEWPRD